MAHGGSPFRRRLLLAVAAAFAVLPVTGCGGTKSSALEPRTTRQLPKPHVRSHAWVAVRGCLRQSPIYKGYMPPADNTWPRYYEIVFTTGNSVALVFYRTPQDAVRLLDPKFYRSRNVGVNWDNQSPTRAELVPVQKCLPVSSGD